MKIYNVEQVGVILGICTNQVYNLINKGDLYPVKIEGRRKLIPEIAIKAYIYGYTKDQVDELIKKDMENTISS